MYYDAYRNDHRRLLRPVRRMYVPVPPGTRDATDEEK